MADKFLTLKSRLGLEPIRSLGREKVSFRHENNGKTTAKIVDRETYFNYALSREMEALSSYASKGLLDSDPRPETKISGITNSGWTKHVQVYQDGIKIGEIVQDKSRYNLRINIPIFRF